MDGGLVGKQVLVIFSDGTDTGAGRRIGKLVEITATLLTLSINGRAEAFPVERVIRIEEQIR